MKKMEKTATPSISNQKVSIAICTVMAWGASGIFIRLLPHTDYLSIASIRMAIGAIVIIPMILFSNNSSELFRQFSKSHTLILGAIFYTCYLLATYAYTRSPIGETALLMTVTPIFIFIYKLIKREKIKRTELLGFVMAFIGVFIVLSPEIFGLPQKEVDHISGNLAALGVASLLAVYSTTYSRLKKASKAPDILVTTGVASIIGAFLCFSLLSINLQNIQEPNFDEIVYYVGLGLIATMLPTLGFSFSSMHLPTLLVTSILLLEPVFATIYAFVFLNETPSITLLPGGVLVLTGIYIISKNQNA
ncbi:DMT family transporter [Aureibacter tunicatorum]|uniref:Drug/metabolite transporter (DMT)-like permease n=1 Tax=Aureibacter tunicatorum TaxID=866807 RepID=A0AAE3XTX1_9BACT|nr:DMT family transporter [Aureibacter tunicatorum]MDR6242003.1 drug/metabolite transporter (DMT)-like permease [Aureibacter tunicatorum]BDD07264.1 DMT transporter permease [Aureibacter tunicatorum]